jgi:predicted RNase H-like HicB family nuclease
MAGSRFGKPAAIATSTTRQLMRYAIVIETTSTGHSAYVPDLPGCVAAAGSYDETLELITEAISLHIEVMRERGEAIPEPVAGVEYAETRA